MTPPRRSLIFALAIATSLGAFQLGRAMAPQPVQAAPPVAAPERPEHPLARRLRERYGPTKSSSDYEEWIIRDFFQDKREGIFLDVGANHHQRGNNTYFLETSLGWSGIAVEPLTRFADGYKEFRPKTIFMPLFVSDVSDTDTVLYIPKNNRYQTTSSGHREFVELFGPYDAQNVRTVTIDILLSRLDIRRIDFLNLDIEEHEPQALAGFSIKRFAPQLVGVEAHDPVQQQLLEYFSKNGYVLIGRYLSIDSDNFWFAPAGVVKDAPRRPTS